jgi:hypothetical protein
MKLLRFFIMNLSEGFMNNPGEYGLFTSRDRRKGEAVAPEDGVNTLEGATTMALW